MYWKTVFQALEDRFECWLLNAHHLRNVPGRKTDVKDSEWICQLVQHGHVRHLSVHAAALATAEQVLAKPDALTRWRDGNTGWVTVNVREHAPHQNRAACATTGTSSDRRTGDP